MSASVSTAKTTKTMKLTSPAEAAPKTGRATTRMGNGRNLKLGRKSDPAAPAPVLGFVNTQGLQGHDADTPATEGARNAKPMNGTLPPFGAKGKYLGSKNEHGYKKNVREPLPPRIISRPDRSKKDIVISPMGYERNAVQQVGKMGHDRRYHWVNTDKFDVEKYDLIADIKLLSQDDRKLFWAKNYVQVDIDVTDLTAVQDVVAHMDKLGKVFTENLGHLYINLIFPDEYDVERLPKHSPKSVLAVPSIAAIVPLVQKLTAFKALIRCVVTLHTPTGSTIRTYDDWYAWLYHAVPFMQFPASTWRLDWIPQNLDYEALPERVFGKDRHKLNVQWAKVEKELSLAAAMKAKNVEKK